jgi:hypothetical protein
MSALVGFAVSIVSGVVVVYLAIMRLPRVRGAHLAVGVLTRDHFILAALVMLASFVCAAFLYGFMLRWCGK